MLGKKDFEKTRKSAKSDKFWGPYYEEMAKKTLVHRAIKEIVVDPKKINAVESMNAVENEPVIADDPYEENSVELVMAPELQRQVDVQPNDNVDPEPVPEEDVQEAKPVRPKGVKQSTFEELTADSVRRPDF